IEAKMDECLTLRKRSQPLGSSCAGCVFKNPEGDSAGRLIDEAGLKGERIGGASVSEDHANFILNDGTATAEQIVQLISLIKMKVRDEYGVQLQEEVRYIGF
ncbi:MAG: UDP-N-acetylenolpyruvoylglucosamine reductase, partial [Candidatus Uhrbacteria bacterium]